MISAIRQFLLAVVVITLAAPTSYAQTVTTYQYDSVGNRTGATNLFRLNDTQVCSTQPHSGIPTDRMIIFGRNLPPGNGAGITVTINGVSAQVLRVSTRVISVEVPVGAGTGSVVVTLPAAAPVDLGDFTFLDLSVDADGDCVPDALEPRMGLDPTLIDSDGDGVPDGDIDSDMDGLTNCEEVGLGTSPIHPDSDGDGFIDGEEVEFGSDPLDPDSLPIDPGGANIGEAVGPLFAIENVAIPFDPIGEAVGPLFAIENLAIPFDPIGEVVGPLFAIENLAIPFDPIGEVVGPIMAILNIAVPDDPISEAVGPMFSIENLAIPFDPIGEVVGPLLSIENLAPPPPNDIGEFVGPIFSIENQENP